ncbi:MAG: polyketide cyclase [Rhodocyclales bacterium]|nr:polyketide cyclase [Rhodocyclales bacterium]
MSMSEALQLSVSIARSAERAYAFLAEPSNFPEWATGLGALRKVGAQWVAATPDGPLHVRFSERNLFGVLDHWVSPLSGADIYIPLRVIANGAGCELIFTLFRQPGMRDEKFEADAAWVERDLLNAKKLLEARSDA